MNDKVEPRENLWRFASRFFGVFSLVCAYSVFLTVDSGRGYAEEFGRMIIAEDPYFGNKLFAIFNITLMLTTMAIWCQRKYKLSMVDKRALKIPSQGWTFLCIATLVVTAMGAVALIKSAPSGTLVSELLVGRYSEHGERSVLGGYSRLDDSHLCRRGYHVLYLCYSDRGGLAKLG